MCILKFAVDKPLVKKELVPGKYYLVKDGRVFLYVGVGANGKLIFMNVGAVTVLCGWYEGTVLNYDLILPALKLSCDIFIKNASKLQKGSVLYYKTLPVIYAELIELGQCSNVVDVYRETPAFLESKNDIATAKLTPEDRGFVSSKNLVVGRMYGGWRNWHIYLGRNKDKEFCWFYYGSADSAGATEERVSQRILCWPGDIQVTKANKKIGETLVEKYLQKSFWETEVVRELAGDSSTCYEFLNDYSVLVIGDGNGCTDCTQPETYYAPMDFSEQIAMMYGDTSCTRTFTFQVTDRCNLACTYCYQTDKGTNRMPVELGKLAIDKLLSGVNGLGTYVTPEDAIVLEFIGGEPFLEISLIDRLVQYFRHRVVELDHPWQYKSMISICSNGVLYDNADVQKFLKQNADILSFSVTVDGTQVLHDSCRVFPNGCGSYELAHNAALDWMRRGYWMGSKLTIAPQNVEFLADSLLAMVRDGYRSINANCVYERGWKPSHARELFLQCKLFADRFLEEHDATQYSISLLDSRYGSPLLEEDNSNWCGGTGSMLAMDYAGRFYPCLRYMPSSLGDRCKSLVIGDVHSGYLSRDCEQQCMGCLKSVTRRSQSSDECFYCPIAAGCAWCSAYNYESQGDVNKRATYICEMHKARVLATVYYWNTYFKKTGSGFVMDLWIPKVWALNIVSEDHYNKLVQLTESLGGFVNKDAEKVRISKSGMSLEF